MRAISPHANFGIQIQEPLIRTGVDTGGRINEVIERPMQYLQFEHFAITKEEEGIALQKINFSGIPEGINPLTTLGVWDSIIYQRQHGLSDEQRIAVEDKLRAKEESSAGRFIVVADIRAPKPWPSYDEDDPDEIVQIASRIGLVQAAIVYEKDNGQREEVLEPLGASVDEPKLIEVSV